MGRRSINTTKSGKYMNPTDQARKEARKKELKKNKKQRQMVRAAVLKGKDPSQILEEMEKIDEMEYNVFQPSPLNEKVLREKRKKLKETFDRVMRLYHTDDPELWAELKRKEVEYEKQRLKKQQYYDSVRHAQTVQVEEIPLPQINMTSGPTTTIPGKSAIGNTIIFPPFSSEPPPGILKKTPETFEVKAAPNKQKDSPGCPPGPPPDLFEMNELDSDAEDTSYNSKTKKSKSIRFSDEITSKKTEKSKGMSEENSNNIKPTLLQRRMLEISGQSIDEFMKEMEIVHKKEQDKDGDSFSKAADASESNKSIKKDGNVTKKPDLPMTLPSNIIPGTQQKVMPSCPPPLPLGLPTALLFRPPPLRAAGPGLAIRTPPGPPPCRLGSTNTLPPRLGIRIPPGPPTGMPPSRMLNHHYQKGMNNATSSHNKDSKGVTTITAKPQIRNLSADVTRFVPSTLRVKRDDKISQRTKIFVAERKHTENRSKSNTKDDAYLQFMQEMQGLL